MCLLWSDQGGTSTAIRGNWRYLQSTQECWHQFPPQWPSGTSVERSNRSSAKLRSPRSADTDRRFAPAPAPLTPLSCLGYTHSARRADSEVRLWNLSAVRVVVNKEGCDFRKAEVWREGRRWKLHVRVMNCKRIFNNISDDWLCVFFFSFLLQNNGSLVWCQNHKQCSKVVWFHFFHERDSCHIRASLLQDNTT